MRVHWKANHILNRWKWGSSSDDNFCRCGFEWRRRPGSRTDESEAAHVDSSGPPSRRCALSRLRMTLFPIKHLLITELAGYQVLPFLWYVSLRISMITHLSSVPFNSGCKNLQIYKIIIVHIHFNTSQKIESRKFQQKASNCKSMAYKELSSNSSA